MGEPAALDIDIALGDSSNDATAVVRGELDVSNVENLYESLRQLISDGYTSVVLDIRELKYMDSTGMAVLIAARRRAECIGGHFRVEVQPNSIVARLLEISGLLGLLTEEHAARKPPAQSVLTNGSSD